jgi:glycosyltransferase involved in cell wall biosynthesis
MTLTVCIIAKNEAANIRNCLESVKWADEIIVLDSGSVDDTVSIAKEFTSKVFSTDWQGFGIQKQRALELATSTWVLNLDADEFISQDLQLVIRSSIENNSIDGYRVPIQMFFYGKPLKYSASPKRHVRLFRRNGAKFSNDIVHEKIILPRGAKISQITTPILHNSFQDVSHALRKINLYSSYSANIRINANKRPSLMKTMLSSSWMFWRCYIMQRGFLDGKAGLMFAIFNAQGSWYRGIKQIYKDKHRENV